MPPAALPTAASIHRPALSAIAALLLLAVGASLGTAQEANRPAERPAERPATLGTSQSTVALTNSMDVLNDVIKLGIGDRVSFRVVEDRREPIPLIVTESGEMEIPLIGRVSAANKTCKQLAREIKPLLERDYFHQATVIIGLDSIGTKSRGRIYLTGQIRTQGGMDIMPDEELTVSKAILRAGGIADFGDKKKVKLIRKQPDGKTTTQTIINMIDILEKGRIEKDIVVEPGDMIVIPERLINF